MTIKKTSKQCKKTLHCKGKKKMSDKFFVRLAKEIKESMLTIQLLPNHRGVRLSKTISGQRELIREMRNKINEIINYINTHDPIKT
jgi:hypothetical protein